MAKYLDVTSLGMFTYAWMNARTTFCSTHIYYRKGNQGSLRDQTFLKYSSITISRKVER